MQELFHDTVILKRYQKFNQKDVVMKKMFLNNIKRFPDNDTNVQVLRTLI